MKKLKRIVLIVFLLILHISFSSFTTNTVNSVSSSLSVLYQTHVEDIGWQDWKKDGELSGTSGQSKRLEGIYIKLENSSGISIKYQVHIQDIGWQDWKKDGNLAGTTGQGKRLEAIKISLDNTKEYSVMYRVHVQNIGWQEWKKDGDIAGTIGQALRLEAIEIKIVNKTIVGKVYLDSPTNGATINSNKTQKITVDGWKMSNSPDVKLKIYVDNNQINDNSISYYQRPDVISAVKDYGSEADNPNPGYKYDIDATKLSEGEHTLKIELYDGTKKLDSQEIKFYVKNNIYVKYQTHVEDIGWQEWKQDGELSGTSGQAKRLEGIKINIANSDSVSIKYQVHIQDIGWQEWKKDGDLAGTTGQAKRLEGIRITLSNTKEYSIMYRVHIQDIGWQEWKKDGDIAGTTGQGKRLEGIEITIINKTIVGMLYLDSPVNEISINSTKIKKITVDGWKMSNSSDAIFKMYVDNNQVNNNSITYYQRPDVISAIKDYGSEAENPNPGFKYDIDITKLAEGDHTIKIELFDEGQELDSISVTFSVSKSLHIKYQAHVQDIGWQDWKRDGSLAGTTGQGLRVEAIKIALESAPDGAKVQYRTFVENNGWQDWKKDGEIAGTTGQGLKVEAIEIKIEGMSGYVLEYQAHVQDKGWQQWVSDEMIGGTINQGLRLEAIQIKILETKNSTVPQVKYSGYINKSGWTNYVSNGDIVGSTNSNNKIEALKIALEKVANNAKVIYQVHVQNVGWMYEVSNNAQAGTIDQGNGIEAIKISLDGMTGYSIEYRVYVIGSGWQNWVRDGATAGTSGENKQIGAIQIKLNADAYPHNNSTYYGIDTTKYPGYKELIDAIQEAHPSWTINLLYTGLNFSSAVYGEYSIHNANLVPKTSGSEWICPVCGTKLYDTGWYGASDKAIAYYMDPRNFINESNIFQFLDVNKYESSSVSLEGIQVNVNGTFLENYATDIDTACRNKGVNPYYVISRLIQENGRKGSTTSRGMDGGDGKIYYNPFNIGASGNGTAQVLANALAKAKANGWDTMEKALEGGITFLKANWLDNYQNTLYQNRFDIDSTNGTTLYSHQYMQNLAGAYTEGNLLKSYYTKAGKEDTRLTFIIPVYEGMSSTISPKPSDTVSSEEYPMNVVVNTTDSTLALRSEASTSSTVIQRYPKGTVLLSVQRGINANWQHVVTKDGKVGYMSGEYLKQIDDEYICNYKAYIKTQSSGGLNVRTGPSTKEGFGKVGYLPDYTEITVIDDSTYQGFENNDWVQWSRIILSDGRQAFVPSSYVVKK